jgi:RND family efflux transporter MFP subunit
MNPLARLSRFNHQALWFALPLLSACQPKHQTTKPLVQDISESVYASGIVKAQNQYQVYASISGIVDTVLVKEGDLVKIGSNLAFIEAETQELLLDNAKLAAEYNSTAVNRGKLEEAKAQAAFAHSKTQNDSLLYERQSRLWAQNIGARVTLEQSKLNYENSRVNEQAARENLRELQRQLQYLERQSRNNVSISATASGEFRVQSKIEGRVYQFNVSEGEIVNPQIPLALIGSDREFLIELQIDESDIQRVKVGMTAMLVISSAPDSVFEAVVTRIIPVLNVQSKTFTIEAEFKDPPSLLYPNVSVEANVIVQTARKALLIPRAYLLNDSTVLLKSGKERSVKTGIRDFQMVQISSGLQAEEELMMPEK